MKDEIYCFTSPGVATIIMLKDKASSILNLTQNDEDDSLAIKDTAKKIKSEVKDIVGINECYPVLNDETIQQAILPTLNEILINISPKFEKNKKSVALISSIITFMISSKVSMLQVAIGLSLKKKINIELSCRIWSNLFI